MTALRRLRPVRSWIWTNFRWIAGVLTVVGLGVAVGSQWDAIIDFNWEIERTKLVTSVVLLATAPLLQGASLWVILRYLGVASRFGDALVVWTRGFLLRYAPSGAFQWVYRIKQKDRLHATTGDMVTATGYEQLIAFTAAGVTCLAAFMAAGVRPPLIGLGLSLGAIALSVAARPGFLGRLLQRRLAKRGVEAPTLLRGRELIVLVSLNLVGWIATGLGAYALISGLAREPVDPFFLTGAFALAWMVGFIAPALPGGVGAREATLVALLAPDQFNLGVATALALALRVVVTVAELIAVGLSELFYGAVRSRRAGSEPAGTS